MPVRGFVMTPQFADQVEDTVQTVQRMRGGGLPPRPPTPPVTSTNVQKLRVYTDEPAGTLAGVPYYGARTLQWRPDAGAHVELFTFDDALVFGVGSLGIVDDEYSGSGSGGGVADVWGKLVASVALDGGSGSGSGSLTRLAFEAFALASSTPSAAPAGGFWAILGDGPCSGGSGGCVDPDGEDCLPDGYAWQLATTNGCGVWEAAAVAVPTLGVTYGTICAYQALEVNNRQPASPPYDIARPIVAWLRPTPIKPGVALEDRRPTFSFEWPSGMDNCEPSCGVGDTAERTKELILVSTEDDGEGGCCQVTTTITFPVDVDVCKTPCV